MGGGAAGRVGGGSKNRSIVAMRERFPEAHAATPRRHTSHTGPRPRTARREDARLPWRGSGWAVRQSHDGTTQARKRNPGVQSHGGGVVVIRGGGVACLAVCVVHVSAGLDQFRDDALVPPVGGPDQCRAAVAVLVVPDPARAPPGGGQESARQRRRRRARGGQQKINIGRAPGSTTHDRGAGRLVAPAPAWCVVSRARGTHILFSATRR